MDSSFVALQSVSKTYRTGQLNASVLHDITLHIDRGEMVAIMGPSGCGKSTLMNIIGLLDRPTHGNLIIEGHLVDLNMSDATLAAMRSQKIGFVFQSFNLLPKMNALANVLVPSIYNRRHAQNVGERAQDLLRQFGLEKRMKHKPGELSGGEKQRVAIARALINDPEIILADEPTGNLDSKSGSEVLDVLAKLHQQGKTVIVVTHDQSIAERCGRTIQLFDGRVISDKKTKKED